MKAAFEAGFNLLCGEQLGEGSHRRVFACKLDPTLVVKVETAEDHRSFANVHEHRNWDLLQDCKEASRWLAPVVAISPCGLVLLQKRTVDLRPKELPAKMPSFLTDLKPENYGLLDGRIVCRDYSMVITLAHLRMRKVNWRT